VTAERVQHLLGFLGAGGLPEHAPLQVDGRVDPEDGPLVRLADRPGLSRCMSAHEFDDVRVGWIMFLIVGHGELERDPELLEDCPPLRRGRGKEERR